MPRAVQRSSHSIFQPDLSEYMLEVPRRRPRFDWFLFAIIAGILFAGGVIILSNLIF
jgi:hypothetical protein